MKSLSLAAALGISAVLAQDSSKAGETPPVTFNNSYLKSGEVYVYEQKPVTGRPALIAAETVKGVVDRFKENYSRLGSPRMVIFVNRDVVNREPVQSDTADNIPGSGEVNTKTEKSTQENTCRNTEKSAATLTDKQTVRDVERLFGRPLRMAGVSLADQRVATELLAGRPLQNLQMEAEQARKDREALGKIADVAVEILISSRQIVVPEVSGDKTYAVPDIQATAIRVSDSRVVGQATAFDIIGKDQYAGHIVRNFDVHEIAEATALALMEDMLLNLE